MIRDKPVRKDSKAVGSQNGDIIADVRKDVEEWVKNQAQEISRLKDLERYRKEFVGNGIARIKNAYF
ncbi:MAG: hypothetical protein AB2L24_11415 [Mangrovibacterium sp.]